MVRLIGQDLKGPVHLFQQDHPHELVAEGKIRKAEGNIGPAGDLGRKPQRPADDEIDGAFAGRGGALQEGCEGLAAHAPAADLQRDDVIGRADLCEQARALGGADLVFLARGKGGRGLFVRHFHHVHAGAAGEALLVLGTGIGVKAFAQLANAQDVDGEQVCPLLSFARRAVFPKKRSGKAVWPFDFLPIIYKAPYIYI